MIATCNYLLTGIEGPRRWFDGILKFEVDSDKIQRIPDKFR